LYNTFIHFILHRIELFLVVNYKTLYIYIYIFTMTSGIQAMIPNLLMTWLKDELLASLADREELAGAAGVAVDEGYNLIE